MTAVFAHRGTTPGSVENTLGAFAESRRLGADGVELDVRLTADGALAVHHDAVIAGLGPLADLTVGQLPAHVPLLADALAVCEGMVVNVEIKNDPRDPGYDLTESVAALTALAIAEAGWTDRVIVSSFQASSLLAVRAADSRLALGALWGYLTDPAAGLAAAVEAGWRAVHPNIGAVTASLVEEAHRAGLAVNAWTVNTVPDLTRCVDLGVDTVITDQLGEALVIARGHQP